MFVKYLCFLDQFNFKMSSFFSNRTTPGSQRKARSTISNTQPAFLYDEENDDFDEIENDESI